jgi:hypothetical protein
MKARELMPNENGSSRLDRIEHALELLIDDHVQFREEHKQLLTAQVVLTDRLDRLAKTVAANAEAQKATDEQLNALIKIVDDMIRNRPQRPNAE